MLAQQTTPRIDSFFKRIALSISRQPSEELSTELWTQEDVFLFATIVKRRLKATNLPGRIARNKPYLTEAHWSVERWSKVYYNTIRH